MSLRIFSPRSNRGGVIAFFLPGLCPSPRWGNYCIVPPDPFPQINVWCGDVTMTSYKAVVRVAWMEKGGEKLNRVAANGAYVRLVSGVLFAGEAWIVWVEVCGEA